MKRATLLVLVGVLFLVPLQLSAADEKTVTVEIEKGVLFKITTESFVPEKHKLTYSDTPANDEGRRCVIAIDGFPFFGDVGCCPPEIKVKSIALTIHGKNYTLDSSFMYNPLFRSHRYVHFVRKGENIFMIRANFSDGGGSYCAEWYIGNGKSARTILTDDEGLCGGFLPDEKEQKKEKKDGVIPPPRHSEE
ncbi:MAG TPA: hypothetical protein PKH10_05340 [bacterium]|nr:hypothetical protein [bacterium]